jgi:hypothetical protein
VFICFFHFCRYTPSTQRALPAEIERVCRKVLAVPSSGAAGNTGNKSKSKEGVPPFEDALQHAVITSRNYINVRLDVRAVLLFAFVSCALLFAFVSCAFSCLHFACQVRECYTLAHS